MGAREDYMALRRAAATLENTTRDWERGPGVRPLVSDALVVLLRKAGTREVAFLTLAKTSFYPEVVDLAYAVLGEERPGGPAVKREEKGETDE